MSDAPTLELRAAMVRSSGASLTSSLDLSATSPRVGLLGDWSALQQVLTGQAELGSGTAHVLGYDLANALEAGVLGLALCDPPLPGAFTVSEYLEHAARLSHGSAARARRETQHTLERFGLNPLAVRKLSQLALFQRRALGVALASLTAPAVIWLDCPLRGLDAAAADYVARLCAEAGAHSRVIVCAPLPSSSGAERSLFETCGDLFLLERGLLVARGTPAQVFAPNGRYLLSVTGDRIDAYAVALREAGCALAPRARPGDYIVELPADASSDVLLDTALEQHVIVVELEPVLSSSAATMTRLRQ